MFDFPGTPTNGQMFTPVAGGPSYVFQSPVWRLAAGGVNPGFWVGDGPPSSPVQGTLWWESDSGNSFIWYDDGSSGQWVQFNIAPPVVQQSSPFKRTVITASTTTFQYDPETLSADVEVQGGGGVGGGVNAGTAGLGAAAPGGGAGGYVKKLIIVDATVRAATKTIVIGAQGGPGTGSSYNDTVSNLLASGGTHGVGGSPIAQIAVFAGGGGGAASGGDINIPGQSGGNGIGFGASGTGTASTAAGSSGAGGSCPLGAGGRGQANTYTSAGNTTVGGAGQGYGSGGGGGLVVNAGSAASGGSGGNGVCIITEYR